MNEWRTMETPPKDGAVCLIECDRQCAPIGGNLWLARYTVYSTGTRSWLLSSNETIYTMSRVRRWRPAHSAPDAQG
jgi:hypothetical protein